MMFNFPQKLWLTLGGLVLIFLFSACTTPQGGGVGIDWGKQAGSRQPVEVAEVKQTGPPAHAPAHGYRKKYHYTYYPSANVYHDDERQIYFYLYGQNWRVSASLPGHIRLDWTEYVNIEMENDIPYTENDTHKRKYPPGQLKKSKLSKKH